LIATVTGSGSNYDVSVSGMTSPGVVIANVIAGAATGNDGQLSLASTSTDNSVSLLLHLHNLVIIKQAAPTVIAAMILVTLFRSLTIQHSLLWE